MTPVRSALFDDSWDTFFGGGGGGGGCLRVIVTALWWPKTEGKLSTK